MRPRRSMLVVLALPFAFPAALSAQESGSRPPAVRPADADSAVRAAIPAATQWLALLDAGDYDATWQTAAPQFQSAIARASWSQQAGEARSPLQPLGDRTLVSVQFATLVPDLDPGRYLVFQYLTAVAGDRSAIETLSMASQDDGSMQLRTQLAQPGKTDA